ncbi:MAG: bifunctional UDP-N-acetylglucosamine diphosphorylase/glucosamine-1-phosphate N-acetyltransferase GlmU [Steroidobacteraceae bacterium]|jgi:bifunctional UDP-N-acetylglucosamine pyrophosphorylase/glucosamine-1-phosphate N-acetyltransferase
MPLSVVILAAGQGKRMNSDLPKVLQPLAGKPLLAHVIQTARRLAPDNIYVVYGHGGSEVQAAFEHERIDWVLQAEQLGTGHAVMQAMPMIPDDHLVLILYGDVPLIRIDTLRALLRAAHAPAIGLVCAQVAAPAGYGRVIRDSAGAVGAIIEQKDATPAQLAIHEVNAGIFAIPAQQLRAWLLELRSDNAQHEFYLTDVVASAVRAGTPIHAVPAGSEAEILGVNDRLQLAQVESAHRHERARELMLAGATLVDPARVDIRGHVRVGRDVSIDVNAVLLGEVSLGARVRIGPNCVIRDSEIGADTEIRANSIIEQARVGQHCVIGPFARLRPETVLDAHAHIGNFVEVKNSHIGEGSKANHLSYLGDSHIGAGVNVGAGTVTCNYDGANKSTTVIEDGAFIGSGSMLVAPVRIGADATIGAGSTITTDAPAGKLSLTRAQQATVEGWTRPDKREAAPQPKPSAKPKPKR